MEDGKKCLHRFFQITNKPLGFCERKTSLNQPRLNHPIADELFIVASQKSQSHSQATVRAVLRAICVLVVLSLQANRSLCCVQMFCANAQCTIILDPTF